MLRSSKKHVERFTSDPAFHVVLSVRGKETLLYRTLEAFIFFLVPQSWCPPGWYRIRSSCVCISPIPSHYDNNDGGDKWNSAQKSCNEKGADLMIPRDQESLNALFIAHTAYGFQTRRPLFLGSRENFNIRWKWFNGDVVAPDLWGQGEPGTDGARCGVIENFEKRWVKGCGWWLATRSCERFKRAYICETAPGKHRRFCNQNGCNTKKT